jgi:putative spermidine/putrescine transport system permease protein
MALLDQTADGLAAAVSGPAAGPVAADDGGERASWFQISPLVVVLTLFFGLPMLVVLAVSFFDFDRSDIIPAFIFDNYAELFRSEVTLRLYMSSIKFALIVWAVTFVLGFNVAYFLVFHVRGTLWQIALFLLCTVPFLTSNIIRMISWIPVLGRNGLINSALIKAGIVPQPIEWLLYSDFAVILAMVHLYTLFMVTPIFNTLMRIDHSLFEAARDAGASGWQILWNVVIPLAKPGIAIGTIFVVTLVMADFSTVQVMSGGQSASVALMMKNQMSLLQYPAAAANAVVLLILVLMMVAAILRVVDIRKEL